LRTEVKAALLFCVFLLDVDERSMFTANATL
jgi:hypothetical protein